MRKRKQEKNRRKTSRTSGSCPPPTRSSPSSLPSPSPPASEYIELENGVIFALRRVLSEIRPFQNSPPFSRHSGCRRPSCPPWPARFLTCMTAAQFLDFFSSSRYSASSQGKKTIVPCQQSSQNRIRFFKQAFYTSLSCTGWLIKILLITSSKIAFVLVVLRMWVPV